MVLRQFIYFLLENDTDDGKQRSADNFDEVLVTFFKGPSEDRSNEGGDIPASAYLATIEDKESSACYIAKL